MGNCEDLDCCFFFSIDNCKGKAVEDKFSGREITARPLRWRFDNQLDGVINFSNKFDSCRFATFQVPNHSRLEFSERRRVNLEDFSGH